MVNQPAIEATALEKSYGPTPPLPGRALTAPPGR